MNDVKIVDSLSLLLENNLKGGAKLLLKTTSATQGMPPMKGGVLTARSPLVLGAAYGLEPTAKSPDVLGLCKGESGNSRHRNGEHPLPLPQKGDLQRNLKEGVRERATRWAEARHCMQWPPSLEVGWSGKRSGTGNLFFCAM